MNIYICVVILFSLYSQLFAKPNDFEEAVKQFSETSIADAHRANEKRIASDHEVESRWPEDFEMTYGNFENKEIEVNEIFEEQIGRLDTVQGYPYDEQFVYKRAKVFFHDNGLFTIRNIAEAPSYNAMQDRIGYAALSQFWIDKFDIKTIKVPRKTWKAKKYDPSTGILDIQIFAPFVRAHNFAFHAEMFHQLSMDLFFVQLFSGISDLHNGDNALFDSEEHLNLIDTECGGPPPEYFFPTILTLLKHESFDALKSNLEMKESESHNIRDFDEYKKYNRMWSYLVILLKGSKENVTIYQTKYACKVAS